MPNTPGATATSAAAASAGARREPPPPPQQYVEMRARITKDILTLLQTPGAAAADQGAAEVPQELARRLEAELWARAGGQIEDYIDLSTLKHRLQALPEYPRPAPAEEQGAEQEEAEADGEEQGQQEGGNDMDWQDGLWQAQAPNPWAQYPQGPQAAAEEGDGEGEGGDDEDEEEGEGEEEQPTLAQVLANIMLPPPAAPWNPQSESDANPYPGVRLPPPLPGLHHGYVHPVQAAAAAAAQQPFQNPHMQQPPHVMQQQPHVMQQQPPQQQPQPQQQQYPILQYNPNIVMPPPQGPPRPSAAYLHWLQHTAAGRYQILHQQQQRLLFLRHASRCQLVDGLCPAGYPNCPRMKALWSHIARCSDQRCQYQHCTSSRYVLSHYHQCHDPACPVCGPVRATIRHRRMMEGNHRPKKEETDEQRRAREAREAKGAEERELQAYLDAHAENDLCCPIGLGLFEDPVVFTDGMTYDREHILRHIQECITRGQPVTSPKTNEVVVEPIMLPNVLIRSQVLEYKNRTTAEWRAAAAAARRANHEEREREEETRDRTADERRRIASPALRGAEEEEESKAAPAVVAAEEGASA